MKKLLFTSLIFFALNTLGKTTNDNKKTVERAPATATCRDISKCKTITFEGDSAATAFRAMNDVANCKTQDCNDSFVVTKRTSLSNEGIIWVYNPYLTCRFFTVSNKYDCTMTINEFGMIN